MFLDERITEKLLYGSGYTEEYAVQVSETQAGNSYRKLLHPYPLARYNINLLDVDDTVRQSAVDLYQRSGGMFGGFRAKHFEDFSTNNYIDVPTYNDQKAELTTGTSYQITRWYGDETDSTSTRRRVKKPVADSVLVGIRDDLDNPHQIVEISTDPEPDVTRWTVDNSTGVVTFTANSQNTITGISQAASAVITLGASHGRVVDDSVHISSVSGMTEINGLRGTVTAADATTVTVNIDSSLFTAYSSGGETNTAPQTNETVTAGCYFDLPMRFDSELNINFTNYEILSTNFSLVEILNP
tara:strand:- start:169 stop:1065 length:897 start_codon:yes stop_codon:yes gene_type:complete